MTTDRFALSDQIAATSAAETDTGDNVVSQALVLQLLDRVEALEAENRRLNGLAATTSALDGQVSGPAAEPTPCALADMADADDAAIDMPGAAPAEPSRLSRRRMLAGGAIAAVAGGAAVALGASPAAANSQGQSFTLGDPTNTATNTTGVTANTGTAPALEATSGSQPGYAIRGTVGSASGIITYGAAIHGDSSLYPGVFGTSGSASGVAGVVSGAAAGFPPLAGVVGSSSKQIGVHGVSDVTSGVQGVSTSGEGVLGQSTSGIGVLGQSSSASGVQGRTGTSGFTGNAGVVGEAATTYGVAGFSKAKSGVRAASSTSEGIYATSTSGLGGRFGGARAAINLIPRSGTGRPTTGAHGRGDLVVDSAGALFLCTASGTPGTWVRVTTTPA